MNPGDSQITDWLRGGHTVPGGLDGLGRKVPRLTVLDPAFFDTQPARLLLRQRLVPKIQFATS